MFGFDTQGGIEVTTSDGRYGRDMAQSQSTWTTEQDQATGREGAVLQLALVVHVGSCRAQQIV